MEFLKNVPIFFMKSIVQGVDKVQNQHLYFYHKTIHYTFRCVAVHTKKTFNINTQLTVFVLVSFVFNINQLYKITVVFFLVKYTCQTPGSKKQFKLKMLWDEIL